MSCVRVGTGDRTQNLLLPNQCPGSDRARRNLPGLRKGPGLERKLPENTFLEGWKFGSQMRYTYAGVR